MDIDSGTGAMKRRAGVLGVAARRAPPNPPSLLPRAVEVIE